MKKRILRLSALLLSILLLSLPLCSCASTGEPLLTLEADGKTYTYSVNLYELYLSAVKGNLVAAGVTVNGASASSAKYWNTIDTIDGKLQTVNEYYLAESLKECKYALTGLYLFDKYQLSLSSEENQKIEDDLRELVLTDGNGSKNALNSKLSEYGVNYDMMREHYTNKLKISAVQNYLYSLLGDNVKKEHLDENYVHFQQIFLAGYHPVYMKDDNGDVIYYDSENDPLYKETPFKETKNGVTVYYTDSSYTHFSYDEEKGTPAPKINAAGTGYEREEMTQEEAEVVEARAKQIETTLKNASREDFEAAVKKESEDKTAVETYTDGYYLKRNKTSDADWGNSYAIVLGALESMKVDEVALVETPDGYHIIKKYENTDKAYEKTENEAWFEDFATDLTKKIYYEACEPYIASVATDEALLETAKNMLQVPVNHFYY